MSVEIILAAFFCSIAFASANIYEGYKIYDIIAKNEFERDVFFQLTENSDYDFFVLPKTLGEPARVMVQPKDQLDFENTLNRLGIETIVVDDNVAQTAELERERNQFLRTFLGTSTSLISFASYQRHDDINGYLDHLATSYRSQVIVKTIGRSYEKRDMKAIIISNGDGRSNKKVILIDAGIHAREWIAPAAALYIIHQLVENFNGNRHLLMDYDWIVLPVVNPDGYEYTHTKMRFWRKTRKPNSICCGTDANRNFGFHWGEIGASNFSCSETFMGTSAFSEPETQALGDLMLSVAGRTKFYLTLHSYGNFLLYPWGFSTSLPSNWKDIDEVAQAGASAIKSATGTVYTVGSSTNVLYAAAGGSDDYALGVANISISITMELPAGGTGFDPHPEQIEPIVSETWIGIKAMAEKVISKY